MSSATTAQCIPPFRGQKADEGTCGDTRAFCPPPAAVCIFACLLAACLLLFAGLSTYETV